MTPVNPPDGSALPRESRTGLPAWNEGELPAPHRRTWRDLLGPGIVMAGASLGAGEWLLGPAVTVRYGGALLWITLLTLVAQYVYNVEASRYTLATGEGIMTGKLRLKPGSRFWTILYAVIDFWTMLPYQLAGVAVTLAALFLGRIPNPTTETDLMRTLTYVVLILFPIPLIFGGTIYRMIKGLVMVKVFYVLGFTLLVACFLASWSNVREVLLGFVSFGSVPAADGTVVNVFSQLAKGEALPKLDTTSLQLFTALERWRGWLRMVRLDQWLVWIPASLIGLALPALISLAVVPRGTVADRWVLAGMMAEGASTRVGGMIGHLLWHGMLLCGFLIFFPVVITTVDGFLRRWVDITWTSFGRFQKLDPQRVKWIYYGFLVAYLVMAGAFLSFASPLWLVIVSANVMNFALGLSCLHTLAVNVRLLPPPLRPSWSSRIALGLSGLYFLSLAGLTLYLAVRA